MTKGRCKFLGGEFGRLHIKETFNVIAKDEKVFHITGSLDFVETGKLREAEISGETSFNGLLRTPFRSLTFTFGNIKMYMLPIPPHKHLIQFSKGLLQRIQKPSYNINILEE